MTYHLKFSKLPSRHKAVIAALTCEKMYPLYLAFSGAENWGNPTLYQHGINALYNFALTGSKTSAIQLIPELPQLFPDLDEFEGSLASFASDSCIALDEAILFISNENESHFNNHLTAATDCIDMFVQLYLDLDPNRSDLNEIIDKDAYMQQEYGRRNKLFIELQQTAHIDLLSVEALKALNGKAPLVALEYLPD